MSVPHLDAETGFVQVINKRAELCDSLCLVCDRQCLQEVAKGVPSSPHRYCQTHTAAPSQRPSCHSPRRPLCHGPQAKPSWTALDRGGRKTKDGVGEKDKREKMWGRMDPRKHCYYFYSYYTNVMMTSVITAFCSAAARKRKRTITIRFGLTKLSSTRQQSADHCE